MATWPGGKNAKQLETSQNITCGRDDCGAVAYLAEGARPVVIECGICLKRGQGRRCSYRCPNGVARGDDLATVEAEWLDALVEPDVPS